MSPMRDQDVGHPRTTRETAVIPLFAESADSFLRPAQRSRGRRAQRRSRAAAGRRSRLALDGREHDGIGRRSAGGGACSNGAYVMDLLTLVTACALAVDPKLMHALVWHQSGGEPWAISVQGEPNPRVYPNMDDAIRETRASFRRRRRACRSRRRFGITIESLSIGPSAVPQRRDGGRPDHQARQSLQGASASQEPIRPSARLQSIAARGSSRTSSSRPTSRHRLRRAMRRTSTCRAAPAPRFSTRLTMRRPTPRRPSSTSRRHSPSSARGWSSALFPTKVQASDSVNRDNTTSVIRRGRTTIVRIACDASIARAIRKIVSCSCVARQRASMMKLIASHRQTAKTGAQMSASREGSGNTTVGGQDKRPRGAARLGDGRGIVLASVFIVAPRCAPAIAQPAHATIPQSLQRKSHLAGHLAMTSEDDFRIRPGRIRSRQIQHAKPFVAQALAAAQKAGGHVSRRGRISAPRASRFGRGRVASVQANRLLTSRSRLATIKTRIVRHSARRATLGHISIICAARA